MAAKKKKKKGPSPAAYEAHRERQAEVQAEKSKAGRDIGELPEVVDPKRKARAKESFESFCREYFPETFSLPWSNDHRRGIERIQTSVKSGGLFAYAFPRGSGKTSLAESGVLWAALYGYRLFPLVIGSDESAALELLESVKTELECNDLLLEDFPEVCFPIRALEGIAHRCNGQLFEGQRTHICWTAKEIVLPTIPRSAASGAVIAVTGITGRIRGMKYKRASDGRSVRPDLVVIDDPQTDESAKSPSQCTERVRILSGAVLGLAGPGKKISGVMPCTVIRPGDMADEILDRQKHPEWQGERTKLIYSFPENGDLWEQYRKLRGDSLRAGNGGKEATDFYRANREAMDKGAAVAWPVRHNPDELSAVQHAMNLRADLGDAAFFSEYQNEPLPEFQEDDDTLTAEQVAAKLNGLDRGAVPTGCNRVVGFVDVQKTLLYWAVVALEDDFSGYVLDYGTFPDQKGRQYFTLRDARHTLQAWAKSSGRKNAGLEEIIYAGLEELVGQLATREWPRDDGAALKIERMPIDANWGESTDVIYKFCRESAHSAILVPSHGRYVGATSRPFNEYRRKRGDRIGASWRMPAVDGRRSVRYLVYDTNWWKSFTHKRFAVPKGGRGCLSLFGRDAERHRMFAEQATSERPLKVASQGRTVIEYKLPPSRPDNHMLDVITGCMVAGSVQGVSLLETTRAPAAGKRVRLSDMQKQRKVWRSKRG